MMWLTAHSVDLHLKSINICLDRWYLRWKCHHPLLLPYWTWRNQWNDWEIQSLSKMSGLRNVREAKFFHKNSHYMDLKKKTKTKKTPKILVKIEAKLSSGMKLLQNSWSSDWIWFSLNPWALIERCRQFRVLHCWQLPLEVNHMTDVNSIYIQIGGFLVQLWDQ